MALYEIILMCVALGCVAGLLAGLFGVGGGLVIVPALVALFTFLDVSPEVQVQMAVGTSLATIVLTSISSIRGHWVRGSVDTQWLIRLAPSLVVGAWVGSWVAHVMDGRWLALMIGGFACFVGLQMLIARPKKVGEREAKLPIVVAGGGGIGVVSALFGIGGGTLTVPFLLAHRVAIQKAIGVSAACGLPIALGGAVSAVYQGMSAPSLPDHAIGYLYWPAFLGIILTSIPCAQIGASLAHYFSQTTLKRLFACLLLAVGAQFIYRTLFA